MKKTFKMPNVFVLLIGITAFVAALTWIVPAGTYQYVDPTASKPTPIPQTYSRAPQNPQGVWEVISAPINGLIDAFDISLFILVIGGFLTIIIQSGAMDAGLAKVIKNAKGKETSLIPVLMGVMALGGTTFGLAEETIAFYPLLVPVFLAVGFDPIVAVAVILLGSVIGVLNSTVNPFATGVASGIAGISIGEGIFLRISVLLVQLIIASWMVTSYAKKVKENPNNSLVAHQLDDLRKKFLRDDSEKAPELTPKRVALLWIFGLTFLIMVLGVVPWGSKFGITIFEDSKAFVAGIPFIGSLVGNIPALGTWWFAELSTLFFISAIICGKAYGMTGDEIVKTFLNGTKDFMSVALIVGVSRGITLVMNAGGMTATVLALGESTLANVGQVAYVVLSYIFFIPMALLIPSTSGLATLTMPIFAPLAEFINVPKNIIIDAFQSASGFANLITPTSSVVMGGLTLAGIDYVTWLKFVKKPLLMLFITTILGLIVGIYI